MARTYTLKIVSDALPGATRSVEFLGSHTLGDVQAVMAGELGLDPQQHAIFFMSGLLGDTANALFADAERQGIVWRAALETLDLELGGCIAHVHDLRDPITHRLEIVAAGERVSGVEYPRILAREQPPAPATSQAAEADATSVPFEAAMVANLQQLLQAAGFDDESQAAECHCGCGEECDGDCDGECESDGDEECRCGAHGEADDCDHAAPPPADLPESLAAAHAALQACSSADALGQLENAVGGDVVAWIFGVAQDAVAQASSRQGIELFELLEKRGIEVPWAELASELAYEGEVAQAHAVLARAASGGVGLMADGRELASAVIAFKEAKVPEAEKLLRQLLGRRWLAGDLRERAVALLSAVLESTGRKREARQLLQAEDRRDRLANEANAGTIRHDAPTPSPNDPCPCGSGKKHKKCCGAV
jgi:hypothetical protein